MAYQYITNRDSPNYTPATEANAVYGMPRVIEGITIHWWGDPTQQPQFNGIVDYLCRSNGNTSAHYIASGTNRQVACIVDPANIAWHAGSAWGNARTIGIECDPRCRDEDYDVIAELIADIRSAYGDVPLYWHNYFYQTTCPGSYDIDRLDKLSYTKFSAEQWGQGGDKNPKQVPTPIPTPTPVPQPTPAPIQTPVQTPVPAPATAVDTSKLYKLIVNDVQVAAYSTDTNAYRGYVDHGKSGIIKLNDQDVTSTLVSKFTTPSPTTLDPTGKTLPDSGLPIAQKDGYTQVDRTRDNLILTIVQQIWDAITSIFKGKN